MPMPDWFNAQKLKENILSLSSSDDWAIAKWERRLDYIYFLEPGQWEQLQSCLCGHYPIQEVCVVKNNINWNLAEVGNQCVKKFMVSLDQTSMFDSLSRIKRDRKASASVDLINYSHRKLFINDWEKDFCISTYGKKKLSGKQQDIRVKINNKIVRSLVRNT